MFHGFLWQDGESTTSHNVSGASQKLTDIVVLTISCIQSMQSRIEGISITILRLIGYSSSQFLSFSVLNFCPFPFLSKTQTLQNVLVDVLLPNKKKKRFV